MDQFLKLIEYSAASVTIAVGILLWVHGTFQTKKEADRELEIAEEKFLKAKVDMERSEMIFQQKIDDVRGEVAGVHADMKAMRTEFRDELGTMRRDLHGIRLENVGIAKDLTYIKARLEPRS